jgi:hypothetical protein
MPLEELSSLLFGFSVVARSLSGYWKETGRRENLEGASTRLASRAKSSSLFLSLTS